ncbi:MarR family winged helix-turn-helix transcriptional regulator [Comamonas sp.]|uniref:MarR family winged helix-turn-helix transcriptional regulator n=1 Tax=Comamonas sp. TaxID=34028 RepID=UPI0035E3334E
MPNSAPTRINPNDASTFFYQAGVYAPDRSIGFLMRRVLSSILQLADAQLAEQGLTYVQWLPLYKLSLCADTNSSTLAKDLGMDPASVTRALDRIEAKGLLRRERSTTDRRVVHLVLTEEGRSVATQVPKVLTSVLNGHLSGFSHEECALMLSMLQRMLTNGDALREALHPPANERGQPSPERLG